MHRANNPSRRLITPGRATARRPIRRPAARRPAHAFTGADAPPANTISPEAAAMQTGCILRLYPNERFGVIETPDGHEAYFSSECVARESGGFDALRPGDQVTFASEEAEQGMRAISVRRRGEDRRA